MTYSDDDLTFFALYAYPGNPLRPAEACDEIRRRYGAGTWTGPVPPQWGQP